MVWSGGEGGWAQVADDDGRPDGLEVHRDGRIFIADCKRGLRLGFFAAGKVRPEMLTALAAVPSDGRLFEDPVQPFDLAAGPGVGRFRQPVLDPVPELDAIKAAEADRRPWPRPVARGIADLHAAVPGPASQPSSDRLGRRS